MDDCIRRKEIKHGLRLLGRGLMVELIEDNDPARRKPRPELPQSGSNYGIHPGVEENELETKVRVLFKKTFQLYGDV